MLMGKALLAIIFIVDDANQTKNHSLETAPQKNARVYPYPKFGVTLTRVKRRCTSKLID